jgi:acetylornithine deacetylase/succinyl-diaminopimelate desuccinylase-like protein
VLDYEEPAGVALVLNGHLDIYELSEDWARDPFAAALEDGRSMARASPT